MKRENSTEDTDFMFEIKKRRISKDSDILEIIELTNDAREQSPSDSGFKEQTIISISDTSYPEHRGSKRIQKILEEEQKLTNTERTLKQLLKSNNLVHPLEKFSEAMNRYNPKVTCRKLSKYEVTKQVRLGQIVPKVPEFPNEIEFSGMILHKWRNYDGQHPHYFVRWRPVDILDDEWIIADYASATKLKKTIKLADLNAQQRRIVCDRILNGLKL